QFYSLYCSPVHTAPVLPSVLLSCTYCPSSTLCTPLMCILPQFYPLYSSHVHTAPFYPLYSSPVHTSPSYPLYSSPVHTAPVLPSVLLSYTYCPRLTLHTPLIYILPPSYPLYSSTVHTAPSYPLYSPPVHTAHSHTPHTPLLYILPAVIPPHSSPAHITPMILSTLPTVIPSALLPCTHNQQIHDLSISFNMVTTLLCSEIRQQRCHKVDR
ncbi:hypothetical protein AB205_0062070, partial [Aquarana catesbeiana]